MYQRKIYLIIIVILGVLGAGVTALLTYQQVELHLRNKLAANVGMLSTKVDAQLDRFSQLPTILADDPRLLPLLRSALNGKPLPEQSFQSINQQLKSWAGHLKAEAIYLQALDGLTLASSNWLLDDSFVGQNFHYRPYFQQAKSGEKGHYFALGAHSHKRGYYFSAPVKDGHHTIGVLTVKVDLSIIEDVWHFDGLEYVLSDNHGVIFYSSETNWLYHSLIKLPENIRDSIIQSRQYGQAELTPLTQYPTLASITDHPIHNLPLPQPKGSKIFLLSHHQMAKNGWHLYGLVPQSAIIPYLLQAVMMFAAVYSLLCVAIHSWWQTYRARQALSRLNRGLEKKIAKRTDKLLTTNRELKHLLEQYERSQEELKQTQTELIQAAKLATLGELSASINHEINQPLTAIRTYAENSQKLLTKQRYETVGINLREITQLSVHTAGIIARLKVFSRKSVLSPQTACTDVTAAIHSAVSLLNTNIVNQGVTLKIEPLQQPTLIAIDRIQFEQVLINLLTNSLHAVRSSRHPQIGIRGWRVENQFACQVWDNGAGLEQEQLAQIFEPFYTTKTDGLGLGLAISRRLVHAHHGQLTAENRPQGGAAFTLLFPIQPTGSQ